MLLSFTLIQVLFFFFFNDTATTEIYTLSLHDALPILGGPAGAADQARARLFPPLRSAPGGVRPRAGRQPAVLRQHRREEYQPSGGLHHRGGAVLLLREVPVRRRRHVGALRVAREIGRASCRER